MTSEYVLLKTNSYIIRMNRDDHLCWFHGKVSREHAEEILREEGKSDGVFLVRESNTSPGDFVLSVLHKGEVWHYQIRRHGEDAFFSIGDETKIHGLDSLIEHYQETSQGLVTPLTAIVKRDPPPNNSRRNGKTNLLHRSTKENNHCIVSELLKSSYRGFDAKNQDGQTAIHLACMYSDEELLKLLIKAGANLNCRDSFGNTPLHYACRSRPGSFIRTLISAKANVQMRNTETGCVALHDAAKYGNIDAVNTLLEFRAPHMPRSTLGEFPMDYAVDGGHTEIASFLEKYEPLKPTTYEFQWYHGTLDRSEAIKLLQEHGLKLRELETVEENGNIINTNGGSEENYVEKSESEDGTVQEENDTKYPSGVFLVRYSQNSGYVLTLLYEDQPKNFIIQTAMKHLYIDEGPYLPSLEHLIQHYSTFSDGLPVNLRYPVPPKPKPPIPLFSTMPKSKKRSTSSMTSPTNSPEQSIPTPRRNLSHPGDDAMNRVGLFEESPLDERKKSKDKNDIFRSLKLRSPKKGGFIDSMKSLRKSKIKSPTGKNDSKNKSTNSKDNKDESELTEALIKNLSFSMDFSHKSGDTFYSIPSNNCAVIDIDIGEGSVGNFSTTDNNSSSSELQMKSITNNNCTMTTDEDKLSDDRTSEDKTQPTDDYYTKSDKEILREMELQKDYFIDPPPSVIIKNFTISTAAPTSTSTPTTPSNFAGYIPTTNVPVFFDSSPVGDLAESAAELKELSKNPERLNSMISITSDFGSIFGRQSNGGPTTPDSCKSRMNYFIPSECIVLENIIGEGEFGSVYSGKLIKCTNENGNEIRYPVAVKTLRDVHCHTNKEEFLREASVMIRLQHHCIVKLIGISNGQGLMMVQELVPLGSMLAYIVNNPQKINPNFELKIWASQIACGMHYLESQHFVHRDLAARNILLASRNQAKISDFGLSRALGSGNDCYQASQGGKWPIKWYAPESFNHGYFSHASDVWSFGVTLWEMFSMGQPPYGDIRGVDAIKLIEEGRRLSKPELCPDNVYTIMENCWNYQPQDRPKFRYLTEFFAKDPDYQNLMELIPNEHIS